MHIYSTHLCYIRSKFKRDLRVKSNIFLVHATHLQSPSHSLELLKIGFLLLPHDGSLNIWRESFKLSPWFFSKRNMPSFSIIPPITWFPVLSSSLFLSYKFSSNCLCLSQNVVLKAEQMPSVTWPSIARTTIAYLSIYFWNPV